jgi:uncharacterized protein YjbI with pentapeptide repeats
MLNSLRTLAILALVAVPLAAQSAETSTTVVHPKSRLFNGISLNGLQFNGFKMNGLQFNGIKFNGFRVNGLQLNGFRLNGLGFNGFRMNGKSFNGTPFDGSLSRRGFVSLFDTAEPVMAADTDWSSLALADVRVRLPLAR